MTSGSARGLSARRSRATRDRPRGSFSASSSNVSALTLSELDHGREEAEEACDTSDTWYLRRKSAAPPATAAAAAQASGGPVAALRRLETEAEAARGGVSDLEHVLFALLGDEVLLQGEGSGRGGLSVVRWVMWAVRQYLEVLFAYQLLDLAALLRDIFPSPSIHPTSSPDPRSHHAHQPSPPTEGGRGVGAGASSVLSSHGGEGDCGNAGRRGEMGWWGRERNISRVTLRGVRPGVRIAAVETARGGKDTTRGGKGREDPADGREVGGGLLRCSVCRLPVRGSPSSHALPVARSFFL